jgi:hypothetical protein
VSRRRELEGGLKNISRGIILPMIGINYNNLPSNFINSYITNDNRVIMVFDKTMDYDNIFHHFLDRVSRDNYHFVEYIDEDEEVLVCFDIPEHFYDDVEMFKIGAYSKLSDKLKGIMCSFFGKKSITDSHRVTEYNMIYPQDFKRKQIAERLGVDVDLIHEVFQRPTLEREVFRPLSVIIAQNL